MTKSVKSYLAVREPGKRHSSSDSLLGSLLIESFVGAAFAPLLPLWAQTVDWSMAADAVDTVWMDRRQTPSPAAPRAPILGLF